MRVTFRTIHDGVNAVNAAAEQFVRAQQQVETGKKLESPSDDPAAMTRVIEGREEMSRIDSYRRSGDTAASRLAVMDTVLSDIVEKITSASVSAAQARGTTADAGARVTIASTLQGLRDSLLSDMNSTFRGRYLFSGAENATPSYAQVGGVWTYQGDHNVVSVAVNNNHDVTIAMDGEAIARGTDANDLFTEMDALIAAVLAADEPAMEAGMLALDRAFSRATRAQSRVGVDQRGIDDQQDRLTDLRLASMKRVSKDEDANLAEAITEMTQAQAAYQAALQAVGSASRVSLLDYLR